MIISYIVGWVQERGRNMKKMMKRNPMAMERGRVERLIRVAVLQNRQCCIWLHIVNGMSHGDVQDELFDDIGRAYRRINFPTVEILEEMPCIRSRWAGCIAPEDAAVMDGNLRDVTSLRRPTWLGSAKAQIWRFIGGIELIDLEECFCEYDADKREGGMIIFFDGEKIPQLIAKYPQLKRRIKFARPDQYDWMVNNW